MDLKKSSGVDYAALDPVKRFARELFEDTLKNPERLGIKILRIPGATATVYDYSGIPDRDFLPAQNVEGLGTKNKVADQMYALELKRIADAMETRKLYRNIGQCTAAMSELDVLAMGADTFLYLDIITAGHSNFFKSDVERVKELLTGYRIRADEVGFAIPQGETPELQGIVYPDTLDLAGTATGLIRPRSRLIDGSKIKEGDRIFGLSSSGIHSNGLTKAREISEKLQDGYFTRLKNGKTLGEELLTPTASYTRSVIEMFEQGVDVHYLQPITGHGWEKIARAERAFTYRIKTTPPTDGTIFEELTRLGGMVGEDMSPEKNYYRWNMGLGYVVIAPAAHGGRIKEIAAKYGIKSFEIGVVEKGQRRVVMPFESIDEKSTGFGKPVVYAP